MSKNINQWAQEFEYDDQPHSAVVTSEDRPQSDEPYFAVVNYHRVHGSSYQPYTAGSKAWREAANRQLSDRARSNFERGIRNHR